MTQPSIPSIAQRISVFDYLTETKWVWTKNEMHLPILSVAQLLLDLKRERSVESTVYGYHRVWISSQNDSGVYTEYTEQRDGKAQIHPFLILHMHISTPSNRVINLPCVPSLFVLGLHPKKNWHHSKLLIASTQCGRSINCRYSSCATKSSSEV
ncbi:fb8b3c11-1522-487d-992f-e9692e513e45 [Sclerotinia trifoliorum]|uniref:Fb8b3c11-1522-487d-992f-e9692e513e45 n=1 Tax=Sclerotinia trifoliorum TaxID=28548 RepID=A0A8H2ZM84_9HELO|nr:fb8b3c11-1522-487d-992f-e9692e513e45 [Sclerotinia trifoliorum]